MVDSEGKEAASIGKIARGNPPMIPLGTGPMVRNRDDSDEDEVVGGGALRVERGLWWVRLYAGRAQAA